MGYYELLRSSKLSPKALQKPPTSRSYGFNTPKWGLRGYPVEWSRGSLSYTKLRLRESLAKCTFTCVIALKYVFWGWGFELLVWEHHWDLLLTTADVYNTQMPKEKSPVHISVMCLFWISWFKQGLAEILNPLVWHSFWPSQNKLMAIMDRVGSCFKQKWHINQD